MTSQYATHVHWDATFAQDLFRNVWDVGSGKECIQEPKEGEGTPLWRSVVTYRDRLCCEPDFGSGKKKKKDMAAVFDSDLNVNRFSKAPRLKMFSLRKWKKKCAWIERLISHSQLHSHILTRFFFFLFFSCSHTCLCMLDIQRSFLKATKRHEILNVHELTGE